MPKYNTYPAASTIDDGDLLLKDEADGSRTEKLTAAQLAEYVAGKLPSIPEVDSDLEVPGAAADAKVAGEAITELNTQLSQRGIPSGGSTGQSLRKKSGTNYDMEWANVGLPTDEQAADAVSAWLDDHPEATTTVQDDSLTEAKFTDALKLKTINEYVMPEFFGAKGDGVTDDTNAFQDALNAGGIIWLCAGKTYYITGTLRIKKNTIIDLNSAEIRCPNNKHLFYNFEDTDSFLLYNGNGNITIQNGTITGGGISFIHGENILISNVHFKDCTNDHYFEICACKDFVIEKCTFEGMTTTATSQKEYINIDNCTRENFPHLPDGETFDGTIVDGVTIRDCEFRRNGTTMADAIGKHAHYDSTNPATKRAKNITIRKCVIEDATEESLLFLGVENLIIESCESRNSASAFTIRNSSGVQLIMNRTIGNTVQSKLSNNDDLIIREDYIKTGSNVRGYVISGNCQHMTYSNSEFINEYGAFKPLSFITSGTVVNDFSAMNNMVLLGGNNSVSYFDEIATGITVNFGQIDYVLVAYGNIGNTHEGKYSYTNFKRMILTLTDGQSVDILKSPINNFAENDAFKRMVIKPDGSTYVATVTITGDKSISISGDLPLRGIHVSNKM